MDLDSIYKGDLDFNLPVYDFDSGISSPDGSDISDLSFDLSIKREEAIKMGASVLDGGPIYNPFIKVKIDEDTYTKKQCCSCCCHGNQKKTTEKSNNLTERAMIFDSQEHFVDALWSIPKTEDDLPEDIFVDTCTSESVLDETLPLVKVIVETFEVVDKEKQQNELNVKKNSNLIVEKRNTRTPEVDHAYTGNNEDDGNDKSDEDYMPPPAAKKPRNSPEPKMGKDIKYVEKRLKNNLAAKRSREAKRQREMETIEKTMSLEKENSDLNKQVLKFRRLIAKLEGKLKS